MAMAMYEEELLQEEEEEEDFWCLQLQRGENIALIPYDDEPFVVTDVFLVDPESAGGQGVVSAWVKMGTRDIMLAQLSSEVTDVELDTPVVLDEEFCFYVMRPDTDDFDADKDAIVVQFEGYVLSPLSEDTDEESEEEDEEAASSEEDDDGIEEEDEESDGEVDGDDVARASNAKE